MPELEHEIHRLRDQVGDMSDRLIRMEVRLAEVCKDVERQEAKDQRVPILLLGAISAASGAISVLFQLWITRGP